MNKFRVLVYGLLLFSSACVMAAESESFSESMADGIRDLYSSGKFFQCADELKKGNYYYKLYPEHWRYLCGCCYFREGLYERAADAGVHSDFYPYGMILASSAFFHRGDYDKSYEAALSVSYDGRMAAEQYDILTARLRPLLFMDDVQGAMKELGLYRSFSGDERAAALEVCIRHRLEVPVKSPSTAMIMSAVVPGSGQLWCGRFSDAFISLAGVCAAAVSGMLLWNRGEHSFSFGAFFAAGLIYCGNIYSAGNSADFYNRRVREKFRQELDSVMPEKDPAEAVDGFIKK